MNKPLTLKIGAHMLDLLNPDPGHIDLRAGVAQKFNSTSENNGFQTRLRASC